MLRKGVTHCFHTESGLVSGLFSHSFIHKKLHKNPWWPLATDAFWRRSFNSDEGQAILCQGTVRLHSVPKQIDASTRPNPSSTRPVLQVNLP